MQSAVKKLEDENTLYKNLLQKKFYNKVFEQNIGLYK